MGHKETWTCLLFWKVELDNKGMILPVLEERGVPEQFVKVTMNLLMLPETKNPQRLIIGSSFAGNGHTFHFLPSFSSSGVCRTFYHLNDPAMLLEEAGSG